MPRDLILGTAGHIDHGKSTLVKTLTGINPDRLKEEQERGLTIDLGFAPLPLAAELQASVVDVPGHEGFVRNMLAGATGIDVALLVIAADEGIMPQTEEHLAIVERRPDVVLLDVQLGRATAFEIIEEIGVDAMPVVVFVTAYDRHAL